MKLIILLCACVALFSVTVNAVCCSRRGDFGCCGNGACNIFCCNCDGGCNGYCENNSCGTGAWFACAGVVVGCAGACVVTEGEACELCLGPAYDQCKGCYGGRRRQLMSTIEDEPSTILQQCKMDTMGKFGTDILEEEEHLLAVFECLAGEEGRNAALTFDQVCDIVGCNTTNKAAYQEVFASTDTNGDGVLTIGEFDADLAKFDKTIASALAPMETSATDVAAPQKSSSNTKAILSSVALIAFGAINA